MTAFTKVASFPTLVNLCYNRLIVEYTLRLGLLPHPTHGGGKECPANLAQRLFYGLQGDADRLAVPSNDQFSLASEFSQSFLVFLRSFAAR